MRKLFPIIILFFIFAIVVIAKESPDDNVPSGMEVITINKIRYLVPKGTKVKTDGGVVSLEGRNEYAARRFESMDIRLRTLEENGKKLRSDIIELLKKVVNKLQIESQQQESNSKGFIEASE